MGFLHAGILSTFPDIRIDALCEKNRLIARYARKMFRRAKVASDATQLSDMDLDIAYVTAPVPFHFGIIKSIYLRNIARNVFVEKTLASNSSESTELSQLAENSSGAHMVGYQKRYAVTFNRVRELLHRGTIGEPFSFECHIYSSDFVGLDLKRVKTISASRGGLLRDLGAHAIDLAMWYFGDLGVSSRMQESAWSERAETQVTFSVRSLNGVEGSICASWCKEGYRIPELRLLTKGTKGTMLVSDDKLELKLNSGSQSAWYKHDLNDNVEFLLASPEYYREDNEFVRCVKEKRCPESDFSAASKIDILIDRISRMA